ncbi:HlyD family efflux transporter periplasmic adaptor subunit [Candidatus Gracilibacteria bacterium]|nr:HlyD family efflux transporter periplasmic adaptor subunit [Candidatus Gracilibacteria bacterium]
MRIPRWAIGSAVLLAGGGGYWYFFMRDPAVSVTSQVVRVTEGSITSSVKTTGKISPVQTSLVSFTRQGTISKLYKNIGDTVTVGDVIAEIDASDAYMDIRNAKISLDNANNSYNKLYSSSTATDKIRAKNTLEESRNALVLLEAQYTDFLTSQKNSMIEAENQIELLEDKYNLAQSDLEYTKKNLDTTSDVSDLERDIASAYISVEEIARFFPGTFTSIKNLTYIDNMSSERYGDLGSKNSYQKTQMEKLTLSISGSFSSFEKGLSLERQKVDHTLDDVLSLLTKSKTLLQDMNTLTSLAVETYEYTPTGIPFSDIEIDEAQAELRTLGSSISTKLTAQNNTYTTLKNYGSDEIETLSNKNSISSKEQTVKSAKNELDKAKRSLEALKTSQNTDKIARQNEVVRAKNSITINEISYNELLKGPEATDLKSAQNSIASANINLEKAYIALKEYQIIAPFDGVINDIPWKVGDATETNEGILVENKNAYEISLTLDQVDIVKIKDGMSAKIVLDAFPNESYTGKVSRVSEVPTETSGVVSYEAVVELSIDRTDIFSKMSVTVEILTTEKNNVLTIPTSAISTEGGKSYVNRAIDREVYARLMALSRSGAMMPPGMSGNTGTFRRGDFGSGGFERPSRTISGERSFSSGTMMSGSSMNTNSGNIRGNSRRNMTQTQNLTTSETIPTEKIEIAIGISSDGKTEVLSGLVIGDVVIISGKSTTTANRSSTTGQNATRTQGVGGFGGGRPPF